MKNTSSFENILKQYDFDLPKKLLATKPCAKRDHARLLLIQSNWKNKSVTNPSFKISHHHIYELPEILSATDMLVYNSTKVSCRRVHLKRKTGANIEALFLEPESHSTSSWFCIIKGKKKLKNKERLILKNHSDCGIEFEYSDNKNVAESSSGANGILKALNQKDDFVAWQYMQDAEDFFKDFGEIPIPPYFERESDKNDLKRYQTLFAKELGSVAAPTAGLHFTSELISKLEKKGIQMTATRLDIGYGTFAPLQEGQFEQVKLHSERCYLNETVCAKLNHHSGRIIALGTTTLRLLETNWRLNHRKKFTSGYFSTDIFLKPPDQPGSIDGLLTNFHLPKSSLLMLVASILGEKNTICIYKEAIEQEYRFFSYGDAMLILP